MNFEELLNKITHINTMVSLACIVMPTIFLIYWRKK